MGKCNEISLRFVTFSISARDDKISFRFVVSSFKVCFYYSFYTLVSVFSAIMEFSLENLGL